MRKRDLGRPHRIFTDRKGIGRIERHLQSGMAHLLHYLHHLSCAVVQVRQQTQLQASRASSFRHRAKMTGYSAQLFVQSGFPGKPVVPAARPKGHHRLHSTANGHVEGPFRLLRESVISPVRGHEVGAPVADPLDPGIRGPAAQFSRVLAAF